jgi:cell division protein FtsI/penicillin-binding protein 2
VTLAPEPVALQSLTPQQLITLDDVAGEDPEVRRIALAALGGREGSAIVMDPRTGRVYAIVNQEWALRKTWTPASLIKLVTAAAALKDKVVQSDEPLRFASKSKALNLTEALAVSSTPYFSFVGKTVGPTRIINYAREFGLGEQTGINYSRESAGFIPSIPAGINVSRFGATGEGIEVTPIQLATLVSAVANGGLLLTPQAPRTLAKSAATQPKLRRRIGIANADLAALKSAMIAVVDHGSGSGAFDPSQLVAGKTGTFVDKSFNVGMFVSYAPAEDPHFVVVVLTRGPKESGPAAANVAGIIHRALRSAK